MLTTSSSGMPSAPISASTVRTASTWPSKSGAEPSTTWRMRSASPTDSRVERKASTTWWGSLRTKPTVSVTSTVSPPGQVELTGPGVKGGEEPVLDEHVGAAHPVEQARLAGVGVADQGDGPLAGAGATLALCATGLVEAPQVGLEAGHAADQTAPVDLEGRLSRTTGADPTGLLAERPAPAPQPGQPVAQEGQLDLGPTLGGAGVLGEDVEDHRGPVDGRPTEDLLQVPLLGPVRGRRRTPRCRRRRPGTPRGAPRPCPVPGRWPGPGWSGVG